MIDPIKFLIRQTNGKLIGELTLPEPEAKAYRKGSIIEKGLMRVGYTETASKKYKMACYLSEVKSPEPITKQQIKQQKKQLKQRLKPETKDNYFIQWIAQELGVKFIAEHKFYTERRWRFDYACIKYKIALEVEGGVFTQGRHSRGAGMVKDMEKYNRATVEGWRLLRVTPAQLLTANTLSLINETIKAALLAQNSNNSL